MGERMPGDRAERAVRAYAYLTASFRAGNEVNDVLDCVVPFVATVAIKDKSTPVNVADVAASLEEFGLRIPRYAVQQLLPRLQRKGYLEWNSLSKSFIPVAGKIEYAPNTTDLSADFDNLEESIAAFAASLDLPSAPFSASWSDALIKFLQSDGIRTGMKSIAIKKAIVTEFSDVENFVIARFIQSSYRSNRDFFESISRIYSGILIEDFITNVQAVGNVKDYKGLKVFYDTSVLMRLLGCSGDELETATLEMHNSLADLGCDFYYLDINRTEVSNILGTILNANAYGHEIFGETGQALIEGEIDIPRIRDLSATFETRLGQLNIFPFDYDYQARRAEDVFQINELDFTDSVVSAALKSDRSYKRENALNDAKAIALIIRLRRGKSTKDLASSKFIFVSLNALLQRISRRFCIEKLQEYDDSSIGPVITVGQITTAGWLATERSLDAHKVSKELLANCYSAVRPSAAWADEFAKALEQFSQEDKDFIADRADAALVLKATRDAVRDQSLNEAAVLRRINVAEIFRQSSARANELEEDRKRRIQSIEEGHRNELEAALTQQKNSELAIREAAISAAQEESAKLARDETVNNFTASQRDRSDIIAKRAVDALKIFIALAFILIILVDKFNPFKDKSIGGFVVVSLFVLFSVICVLDLTGFKPVGTILNRVRSAVSDMVFKFLVGEKGLENAGTP